MSVTTKEGNVVEPLGSTYTINIGVEYDDDDIPDFRRVCIWLPNKILEKDNLPPGTDYHDILCDTNYDWIHDILCQCLPPDAEPTGDYELDQTKNNVPFDDKSIQIAFIDPLGNPPKYEKRPRNPHHGH